jgi:hypothetical protein
MLPVVYGLSRRFDTRLSNPIRHATQKKIRPDLAALERVDEDALRPMREQSLAPS